MIKLDHHCATAPTLEKLSIGFQAELTTLCDCRLASSVFNGWGCFSIAGKLFLKYDHAISSAAVPLDYIANPETLNEHAIPIDLIFGSTSSALVNLRMF
jgi:hypothetical protein